MNAKIVLNLLATTIVVISIVESHNIVTSGSNDAATHSMITRLQNSFVATTETSIGKSFDNGDDDVDRWDWSFFFVEFASGRKFCQFENIYGLDLVENVFCSDVVFILMGAKLKCRGD